jgi:serine/threonine protein phosphatase 1
MLAPHLRLDHHVAEFVIGDVHGCLQQFILLTEAMAAEAQGQHDLTLLGDLIDRGPDSLGCLRHADALARGSAFKECHLVVGNHELMAVSAMTAPNSQDGVGLWVQNGAGSLLAEMGVSEDEARRPGALAVSLSGHLGPRIFELLRCGWVTHRRVGNVLMVHGGIHPEADPEAWFARDPLTADGQEEVSHFAWIRWPFYAHEEAYPGGCVVVHGHTPERAIQSWKGRRPIGAHYPEIDGWRLGLDGGSYGTGVVLGAELQSGRYRIFRAAGQGRSHRD